MYGEECGHNIEVKVKVKVRLPSPIKSALSVFDCWNLVNVFAEYFEYKKILMKSMLFLEMIIVFKREWKQHGFTLSLSISRHSVLSVTPLGKFFR